MICIIECFILATCELLPLHYEHRIYEILESFFIAVILKCENCENLCVSFSFPGTIRPRSKKLLKRGFEVILYETRGRCSCAQEMLEQSFEHAVRLLKK